MSAAAGPASAAASAAAGTDLDLSKYTVFFTGIFERKHKDLVFTGNLAQHPGDALVTGADGEKSTQLATIGLSEFRSYIENLLRQGVCAGNVDPGYVLRQFDDNPIRFVIVGPQPDSLKKTRGNKTGGEKIIPLAFLIGNFVGSALNKGIYIDVICSFKDSNIGTSFLNYFHTLVAQLDRFKYIQLSALPNVLTYYPRLGYRFSIDCAIPGLGLEHLPSFYLTSKSWRGKRGADDKPIWPTDTKGAYKLDDYMNFMMRLHAEKLTKKGDKCANPRLTPEEFEEFDCGEDGFTMVKCDLPPGRLKAEELAAVKGGETGGAAATGAATGKRGGSRRRGHKHRATRRHRASRK